MWILFCYLAENNIFSWFCISLDKHQGALCVYWGTLSKQALQRNMFFTSKKCLHVLHKIKVHFCLSEYDQLFYTPIPLFSFITFGTEESRVPLVHKTIGKCSTLTFLQELSKRDLQYFRSSTITVLGKVPFPLSLINTTYSSKSCSQCGKNFGN